MAAKIVTLYNQPFNLLTEIGSIVYIPSNSISSVEMLALCLTRVALA